MDCLEVRARIKAGVIAGLDQDAQAHLASCPPCRTLVDDGAGLGRALSSAPTAPVRAEALAAFFADLEAEVAAERGPLAGLRSLPTWLRRAIVIALAVVLCAGLWAMKFSAPSEALDRGFKAANVLLLGALAALAIWNALRPLHQPAIAKRTVWVVAILALAVPLGLALMPYTDAGAPKAASHCFTFGSVIGFPVVLLALAMHRAPWTVALAAPLLLIALGAGMIGNLALAGACSDNATQHLVLGHASIMLAFGGVALALGQAFGGSEAPAQGDQAA